MLLELDILELMLYYANVFTVSKGGFNTERSWKNKHKELQ